MVGPAVNHGYDGPNVSGPNGHIGNGKELEKCKSCFTRTSYIWDGLCANCHEPDKQNQQEG